MGRWEGKLMYERSHGGSCVGSYTGEADVWEATLGKLCAGNKGEVYVRGTG